MKRKVGHVINGVFPVFKPIGLTSAELLNVLKMRLLKEWPVLDKDNLKFGHGGTLDQSASGILVVGAGDSCVLLKHFLHGEKSYKAEAVLGVATDTYNAEGKIVMKSLFDHVDKGMLQNAARKYLGRVQQVPPLYSALKYKGIRYSDLARKGENVELHPRNVQCFQASILDFSPPSFTLFVCCGGGFYVRSLIHDVGLAVNSCAHMTGLVRISQGPFTLDSALRENQWNFKDIHRSVRASQLIVNKYFCQLRSW